MGNFTLYCRLRLLKCRRDVIAAVLHSVGMKHRSLASASENACAGSGERFLFERAVVQGHLKLPFRKCCIFFVFYLLLCVAIWASLNLSRIASFKRSWELLLEVSTWLYVLSITLELKIKRIVKPNVFFTIQATLMRRSPVLNLPLQSGFPAFNDWFCYIFLPGLKSEKIPVT